MPNKIFRLVVISRREGWPERLISAVSWFLLATVSISAPLSAATVASGCGESAGCSQLRTQTYADKEGWDACDPAQGASACLKIPGNPRDCTGVLTCDFAVNPIHRKEAELATYTIA